MFLNPTGFARLSIYDPVLSFPAISLAQDAPQTPMEGEQELALRLLSFKQGKQAANRLSFQSSVGLSIYNLPNSLDFPLHLCKRYTPGERGADAASLRSRYDRDTLREDICILLLANYSLR